MHSNTTHVVDIRNSPFGHIVELAGISPSVRVFMSEDLMFLEVWRDRSGEEAFTAGRFADRVAAVLDAVRLAVASSPINRPGAMPRGHYKQLTIAAHSENEDGCWSIIGPFVVIAEVSPAGRGSLTVCLPCESYEYESGMIISSELRYAGPLESGVAGNGS
jgi:hypothetical protein